MKGLAALVRWDGGPLGPDSLAPLVTASGGGSPAVAGDAFAQVAAGASVPGTGEVAQLAVDPRRGLVVALAGRLDAPDEIVRSCGLDAAPRDAAQLLLAGYAEVGDRVFDRLVGPFVAVVVAARERTVVLARDPLGSRSLFLRRGEARLAVASRPSALVRAGEASAALDERSLAAFLAVGGPPAGASYFRDVEELPAGAVLTLGAGGRPSVRRIALVAAGRPGGGRDEDYFERFRELLDSAVACRLPPAGRTAILMSGGLDSTSVAATAARHLANGGEPPPLTISWVFDELAGIDERRWIDAANGASGAEGTPIVADALWPLSEPATWPQPIDTPALSPFAQPRRRALAKAADAGCGVMLTGESADDLWWSSSEWLRSLLLDGRFGSAAGEIARHVGLSLRGELPWSSLRAALARLRRPHGYLPRRTEWSWLTPHARALVAEGLRGGGGDALWREFAEPAHPLTFPLDLTLLRSADEEALPSGVEIRRPYRDRRLVEFMLGAPPRLLYRPGERKRLLRRALGDRLPLEILTRRERTTLLPLYRRGIAERATAQIASWLESPAALWSRFVDPEWLRQCGLPAAASGDGAEALVLWHCLGVDAWSAVWRTPLASNAYLR